MDAATIEAEPVQTANGDLKRRVVNYLRDRHLPSLRRLDVEASDGTVVLRGRVHSFHEKQLCNLCCQRVAGVRRLIDAVDVVPANSI